MTPGFPVQSPLRLCLLGANERMRNTLAMVLDGPARGKGVLADGADVDAVIVDLDSVGAEAEWANYRKRFPDRPALILTVAPRDIEHATVLLPKPFTVGGLIDAIERIRQGRDAPRPPPKAATGRTGPPGAEPIPPSQPVSTATVDSYVHEPTEPMAVSAVDLDAVLPPAASGDEPSLAMADPLAGGENEEGRAGAKADLSDPQTVAELSYDPTDDLLDWARRAREQSLADGAVAVTVDGRRCLAVDGQRGKAFVALSDEALRQLCEGPLAPHRVHMAPAPDSAGPALSAQPLVPLDALLWRLALWTGRGRLPQGTDLTGRIYLRHWPNLTRLDEVAHSMRIASLLVAHPMSLERVVEALDLPPGDVFQFYVAARALGLIGTGKRAADHVVQVAEPVQHPDRGFLRRVVQHLGSILGAKQ